MWWLFVINKWGQYPECQRWAANKGDQRICRQVDRQIKYKPTMKKTFHGCDYSNWNLLKGCRSDKHDPVDILKDVSSKTVFKTTSDGPFLLFWKNWLSVINIEQITIITLWRSFYFNLSLLLFNITITAYSINSKNKNLLKIKQE